MTDAGAMLFRRAKEDESSLEDRLARVERRVEQHAAQIHDLKSQSAAAEDSFRHLLSAVENFCDQAAQQIERVTPAALSPANIEKKKGHRWWIFAASAIVGIGLLVGLLRLRPAQSAPVEVPKAEAAPVPAAPPLPQRKTMRIEIEASEPSWITLTDADSNALFTGVIQPGDTKTIEVDRAAKLRTGNAGGLIVKLDGKFLGPLGPKGKIRQIEFLEGSYKITTPAN